MLINNIVDKFFNGTTINEKFIKILRNVGYVKNGIRKKTSK